MPQSLSQADKKSLKLNPRSQGGAERLSNLRLVHAACNLARGHGNGTNPVSSLPRALRWSPAPE